MIKKSLCNFCGIIAMLFFLVVSSFSQAQSVANADLNKLKDNFSAYFQYTRSIMDSVDSSILGQMGLWGDFYADKNLALAVDHIADQRSTMHSLLVSDLGLKWISDATHNFRPGIAESEDLFFRSRFSTGVDWVIFGEGSWMKSKEDRQYFKKRMERDSIYIQYHDNSELLHKFKMLQLIFDKHKLPLLHKYLRILEVQHEHDTQLHELGLINRSDMVKSAQNVAELKNMMDIVADYSADPLSDYLYTKYWHLPMGFTDLPRVGKLSENELLIHEEQLVNLEMELLMMNKRASDRPSFRTKFRYNYYNSEEHIQSSRSFASIGATLSIPIGFRKNDMVTEYEVHAKERDLGIKRYELKNDLIERHRKFYSLKNDLISTENELVYLQSLMDIEVRVYTEMASGFSPAKYIDYAKQFLSKKIQVLDMQHELCKQYLLFYAMSGLTYDTADLFEKQDHAYDNVQKSTYVWSTFFEENENEYLIQTLKEQAIDEVLISSRDNEKVKDFLTLAARHHVKVERLIGENSYAASEQGGERLLLKLQEVVDAGFDGVHLDIEPHTFDDYKENIMTYTARMNQLFALADNWCRKNNVRLSVSIPMHLPVENARFLAEANIKTHIMAYEEKDQAKLLRRTEGLRTILAGQYIWVLRVTDFSVQELEEAKEYLKSNGINRIGYYDLSTIGTRR